MLNFQLGHREIPWVAGGKRHPDRDGGSRDQAIGLGQRHARRGVIAPPIAGSDALEPADRGDAQTIEEPDRGMAFGHAQTPMDLLDTDCRRKWDIPVATKCREPLCGASSPTE